MKKPFDADYYHRYYHDPDTRAVSPSEAKRQAVFIHAYLSHLGLPVRRILDIGCGLGRVLRALGRCYPRATCVGVEWSEYLCQRYGWEQGSVANYSSSHAFDLVVCNDVLAYLEADACAQAITNLAELSRGALLLSVLTREDERTVDSDRTDMNQLLRPASWYRRRLRRHFVNVGGGLYLKKPASVPTWRLEQLD